MNKKTLLISLLLIAMTLVACGATEEATPELQTPEMPLSTQLLIGTFELDGTDQQVTTEQATTLLPLWKILKSLTTSDTTAQEEIEAVINQIQNAMTSEQLSAIAAMGLSTQSMFNVLQELGIESNFAGNGTGRPEGFQPPEGFVPGQGGGQGMGRGGGGNEQNMSPEQIATAQAARAERVGGNGIRLNPAVLDALIVYLEGIAQK